MCQYIIIIQRMCHLYQYIYRCIDCIVSSFNILSDLHPRLPSTSTTWGFNLLGTELISCDRAGTCRAWRTQVHLALSNVDRIGKLKVFKMRNLQSIRGPRLFFTQHPPATIKAPPRWSSALPPGRLRTRARRARWGGKPRCVPTGPPALRGIPGKSFSWALTLW